MYANILIEYNVKKLDKTFLYEVPLNLEDSIKVGMQVIIPFGKTICNGIVLSLTDKADDIKNIKSIYKIKSNEIILTEELIKLGEFIKSTTLCSLISAYETMLPSTLKVHSNKSSDKFVSYIKLNKPINIIEEYIYNNKRSKKQVLILERLLEENLVLKKELSGSSLNELLKKELVIEELKEIYRLNSKEDVNYHITLNEEQKKCSDSVTFNTDETYLLHGVTGSGKTEVYIHLIKKALKLKKTALLLVPEITLTHQIVKRLYNAFGSDIAIMHSGLSAGEKNDEYKKILRGEVHVVVGTRSSSFVPLSNIGIIIVDEEHSDTYKQENNPRYDAISVLKFRSSYHKCPLVLGSATPSLESYARAKKGVYKLLTMNKRPNGSTLPIVHIVPMEEEYKKGNLIISDLLKEMILERLNNHEQVILFLNRRGYSTILTCPNCGYTYKCPYCDINLTYHKTSDNLRCHYCGYTVYKKAKCPNCKESTMNDFGLGTEKLENIIKEMFPTSSVVRMDQDTTKLKNSHETIINDFINLKYDILLGTQMISKGLDFPHVTLVGVINADQSLNMPDFKANERTFSLLSQVSGRAGRSKIPGEVVIQTMNPTNHTLLAVKDNNYQMFYEHEMKERLNLRYPPYYFLALVKIVSRDYEALSKESTKVYNFLRKNLTNVEILGPAPANMFKINNKFNMQIIIKYRKVNNLFMVLKEIDNMYLLDKKISLEIDTSPKSI